MANSTKQDLRAMLLRTPHIFKDAAGNRGGRFPKKRSQARPGAWITHFPRGQQKSESDIIFFLDAEISLYACFAGVWRPELVCFRRVVQHISRVWLARSPAMVAGMEPPRLLPITPVEHGVPSLPQIILLSHHHMLAGFGLNSECLG